MTIYAICKSCGTRTRSTEKVREAAPRATCIACAGDVKWVVEDAARDPSMAWELLAEAADLIAKVAVRGCCSGWRGVGHKPGCGTVELLSRIRAAERIGS